jgi:hypothetical protein
LRKSSLESLFLISGLPRYELQTIEHKPSC